MTSDAKYRRELASSDVHSCLPDELLLEILCRLPSSKYVLQCKVVCKRWAASVPSPFFIGRFIAEMKQLIVFSSLFYPCCPRSSNRVWRCLKMNLRGTHLSPESVSVYSLPTLGDKNSTIFDVLGSCKDLLFISQNLESRRDYYICNSQTNQRLLLPRLPFCDQVMIYSAFTCDEIVVDATYRYSIVVTPYKNFAERVRTIKAYLFSNANKKFTGKWREVLLSAPKVFTQFSPRGFVFGGMMHIACRPYIIGFDPYDEDGNNNGVFKCRVVDCPSGSAFRDRVFQEYQGQLRMYLHKTRTEYAMQMWCLKDYKTSEWSLLYSIPFQDFILPKDGLWGPGVFHGSPPDETKLCLCAPSWLDHFIGSLRLNV